MSDGVLYTVFPTAPPYPTDNNYGGSDFSGSHKNSLDYTVVGMRISFEIPVLRTIRKRKTDIYIYICKNYVLPSTITILNFVQYENDITSKKSRFSQKLYRQKDLKTQ